MSDDCHELKNITYQTMLLNSNVNIVPKKEQSTVNMESFMEQDKLKKKKKTWSKLDNGVRIKKLSQFAIDYSEKNQLTKKQSSNLKSFLLKALDRKKLHKTKEVSFNVEKQKIIDIPGLNYNKERKKFTLKRQDGKTSFNTRLAPKTIKNKNKKKNKSRGKKTQKTKIDIHLKE